MQIAKQSVLKATEGQKCDQLKSKPVHRLQASYGDLRSILVLYWKALLHKSKKKTKFHDSILVSVDLQLTNFDALVIK